MCICIYILVYVCICIQSRHCTRTTLVPARVRPDLVGVLFLSYSSRLSFRELLPETISRLRRSSPHLAMCWIKTISHAWTTSGRFQEARRRNCFLGCSAPDDLRHCAVCCHLSHLLARVLYLPLPHPPPDSSFLLGLPLPDSLLTSPAYLAFTIYHTCRHRNLFPKQLC